MCGNGASLWDAEAGGHGAGETGWSAIETEVEMKRGAFGDGMFGVGCESGAAMQAAGRFAAGWGAGAICLGAGAGSSGWWTW